MLTDKTVNRRFPSTQKPADAVRTSIKVRRLPVLLLALLGIVSTHDVRAQGGHGPVFGLATPTLPQGAWNIDVTLMSASRTNRAYMARQTLRYGLTEDVQLNLSVPQTIEGSAMPLRTRIGTMMAGMGDVEASVLWRVHKQYPGVGRRFETTLFFSGLYPVDGRRGGLNVGPGVHGALVTGYASRTFYAWGGGGYQRYLENDGDRPGNLGYLSAVVAWRPPVFQGDYPKPDWRIFIESVAEFVGRNQLDGASITGTAGERILVGPTFLGLYRAWGLGAGLLVPVYESFNGPEEGLRFAVNLSYWP